MDQMKASERTMFKIRYRRELIDQCERQIEHHKSMIKNYKSQIKAMTKVWDEQRGREDRMARVDYRVREFVAKNCLQCGKDMNPAEWMLGAVCGNCCRENHRRVAVGYA